MLSRVLKGILILLLSIAVTVLIIIGLIDFDLLVTITPKLIAAIVTVGMFVLIVRRLFLPR